MPHLLFSKVLKDFAPSQKKSSPLFKCNWNGCRAPLPHPAPPPLSCAAQSGSDVAQGAGNDPCLAPSLLAQPPSCYDVAPPNPDPPDTPLNPLTWPLMRHYSLGDGACPCAQGEVVHPPHPSTPWQPRSSSGRDTNWDGDPNVKPSLVCFFFSIFICLHLVLVVLCRQHLNFNIVACELCVNLFLPTHFCTELGGSLSTPHHYPPVTWGFLSCPFHRSNCTSCQNQSFCSENLRNEKH